MLITDWMPFRVARNGITTFRGERELLRIKAVCKVQILFPKPIIFLIRVSWSSNREDGNSLQSRISSQAVEISSVLQWAPIQAASFRNSFEFLLQNENLRYRYNIFRNLIGKLYKIYLKIGKFLIEPSMVHCRLKLDPESLERKLWRF